ncbi:hypothetical protein AB1Y20_016011 [Prymnesium parvum]|uniref:Uncharacterized protein n=1 Tax=Prymnesium parvum TaxID=97485 RepID=A0AB34K336_PRYPA
MAPWRALAALSPRRLPAAAILPPSRLLSTQPPVPNDAHGHPALTLRLGAPLSLPSAFALVEPRLAPLREELPTLVAADHPALHEAARHFFTRGGKSFRPTLVLLASAAAAGGGEPSAAQARLAQVVEMIHAASLLHDDVIDLAETRRGAKAVHKMLGNKVAVLSGDFLLARATRLLARLGDAEVVGLMADVIDEMVAGEMMQAKATPKDLLSMEHYLHKTYRKTAALIALSCESAAVLGQHSAEVRAALQAYGRHLGIAYQLIDDLLDFTSRSSSPLCLPSPRVQSIPSPPSPPPLHTTHCPPPLASHATPYTRCTRLPPAAACSSDELGKPALSDLKQGLATAPTLFALQQFPQIEEVIVRRFSDEGDVAKVVEYITQSDGFNRTKELATNHSQRAAQAIGVLPPSASRDGLLRLCSDVLNRNA